MIRGELISVLTSQRVLGYYSYHVLQALQMASRGPGNWSAYPWRKVLEIQAPHDNR